MQDCCRQLADIDGLGFVDLAGVTGSAHAGRYDAVFCMEVLAHGLDAGLVLDHLEHLVAPSGKVIVSVPIETGRSILVRRFNLERIVVTPFRWLPVQLASQV